MRLKRISTAMAAALGWGACVCVPSRAQNIPRDEYLTYVPLEYPKLVRQTEASAAFNLYGDQRDPRYRDVNRIDGIDDRRYSVLHDLSVRFAPYMVMNTTAIPMNWRLFMEQGTAFPLFVDTWDVSGPTAELVNSDEIDWVSLLDDPCTDPRRQPLTGNPDCRLLALLDEFNPFEPGSAYRVGTTAAERSEFRVMFFDFPGDDEKSWREEYEDRFTGRLPRRYENFPMVYSHPFITELRSNDSGEVLGYEFVLQFWFFYPWNDGGNNHEGDWEHINVMIAPLSRVGQVLSASDVNWILDGGGMSNDSADRLVIRKIDYYFHHKVITLDYMRPSVYQPREAWEQEVKNTVQERLSEDWYWKQIRYHAYWDDEETIINTHPIAFIGADNKGTDQLLKSPGGSNRDSHGTYPFPGLYKDVGPAGAAEKIGMHFDHRRYYAAGGDSQSFKEPRFRRGHTESFADPSKIEIVPDAERVRDLVRDDPQARRDWAWLVLPLRWGFPAAESPFAGVVAHAETGNLSVVGPSYNGGWNRIGDASGYDAYLPHKFSFLFPTTWQDGFANNLGWLNLTAPTLIVFPPFDLLWRVVLAPVRAVAGSQDPILHPNENIPYRFVGLVVVGPSYMIMEDDFLDLFLNEQQSDEILLDLAEFLQAGDDTLGAIDAGQFVDNTAVGYAEISLYLGRRFASENTLRHGRIPMGIDVLGLPNANLFSIRGELNFWEYSGSIRYNFTTSGLMPFLRGGYGLSWYRVENVTTNGEALENPNGPWVRKPTFGDLSSFLPNTWHLGGGLEWVPIRSFAPIPRGIDLGIRGEALVYAHKLGLDVETFFISEDGFQLPAGRAADVTILRPVFNVALTIGF
jgi:hypothetical protein